MYCSFGENNSYICPSVKYFSRFIDIKYFFLCLTDNGNSNVYLLSFYKTSDIINTNNIANYKMDLFII